jgi:hypothetical protein
MVTGAASAAEPDWGGGGAGASWPAASAAAAANAVERTDTSLSMVRA